MTQSCECIHRVCPATQTSPICPNKSSAGLDRAPCMVFVPQIPPQLCPCLGRAPCWRWSAPAQSKELVMSCKAPAEPPGLCQCPSTCRAVQALHLCYLSRITGKCITDITAAPGILCGHWTNAGLFCIHRNGVVCGKSL